MTQVGGDKRKRVGAIKEEDYEGEGEYGKPAKKRSSTQAGWNYHDLDMFGNCISGSLEF